MAKRAASGDAAPAAAGSVEICEGQARLLFDGPADAFYNPAQEINRDLT